MCEPGLYQYCAPDDRKGCHNSCRGHERGNEPVLGPKRSFRQFAAPSTKRSDAASRERGPCRLVCSITKNTYSILNVIVRTQKKSHAQISDPFCLRNDRQVVDGPRRWVRCIYLATVLAETLNPSSPIKIAQVLPISLSPYPVCREGRALVFGKRKHGDDEAHLVRHVDITGAFFFR